MNDTPNLYLLTPLITAPAAIADALDAACSAAGVAAVMLRLSGADERTQVNRIKILAPIVQRHGAAAIISLEDDPRADVVSIAARGGADGIHVAFGLNSVSELVDRLKGERSLGVGNLRSRDDAMRCGEMGVDYVMFGEPRPDGFLPPRDAVIERAQWWAEIFETPCVAFATDLDDIGPMVQTGAEFIALGEAVWNHADGPATMMRTASAMLSGAVAERAK